ncbi:MAG: DUF3800 domain-containing protein [Methylovirgula sp.]
MDELFRALLPLDCTNGWLAMLNSYFDDSGTHDDSEIVVVAGIFGTEGQLRGLDCNWKRHLVRPLEDIGRLRRPLRRFHMYDCQAACGEFTGWERPEIDYFCRQLRKVIIESGVSGYICAVARKDWDELVKDDIRAIMGSAEGNCIRNCFVRTIQWAQHNTFDPQMTFVFDSRPSAVVRDAKVVCDAFQRHIEEPAVVGIAFLSSYKILPLQAADMLAWEAYQYANDLLLKGDTAPQRAGYAELASNMSWAGAQIATRDAIQKIVEFCSSKDPDFLRQAANHFTFFDPENPDYSHLREKPPA